ncbi:MAG: ABC transporter permease, partial [Bacteroidota bacterium]
MNILSLSISYIRQRPLNTLLNTLLLAFGVGIIVFLLLLQSQLQEKFYGNIRGIKMVVGAKGSPLQLILCNVYHIDFPTGNISLNAANQIAENKLFVKSSIPLALGDSYKGFRIVGTNVDYPNFYKMEIQTGKLWENVMEVSIGAEVAQATGLKIGDTFFGAHGILEEEDVISEHDEKAYQVVGIFKKNNNVLDRLILTQVESVWAVHEDHDQESGEEHHDDNEDATHQDNEDATHQDNEDTTHQDNEDATHQDNEDATHQD